MKKSKHRNWGGRRPNQTGRPIIGSGKRIHFGCMVDPTTKSRIAAESAKTGDSIGVIIDRLSSHLKK